MGWVWLYGVVDWGGVLGGEFGGDQGRGFRGLVDGGEGGSWMGEMGRVGEGGIGWVYDVLWMDEYIRIHVSDI